MLLKRVLKHKTSFICYFKFHDLYLFTFSRLKSLPCPSSTHFAGQLAHVIGPLKCYNDDYQCYDYQCYPRLPSYPRFTLSPGFYSHIRVLPSRPSVRPDIRPYIRPDIRPDIRPSVHPSVHPSVCPYPRFTLTRFDSMFPWYTKSKVNSNGVCNYYDFIRREGLSLAMWFDIVESAFGELNIHMTVKIFANVHQWCFWY